jgi:outer membrane protein assembly factor BamA
MGIFFIIVFCSQCTSTRKLKENQYLLQKNKITGDKTILTNAQLLSYVKQKPNKKILNLFKFHLFVYNLVDQEKFQLEYAQKIEKRRMLNEKRKQKEKKLRNETPFIFNKWLLDIGEAPVIVDTSIINRSSKQLEILLKNNGYFDAIVTDSVKLERKLKTAKIFFDVQVGIPYTIGEVIFEIEDPVIQDIFNASKSESLIKTGNQYNSDVFNAERDRITELLKNNGYFLFQKNFISYSADSSVGNRKVDVAMEINNPVKSIEGFVDSNIVTNHVRFKINEIYIKGDYQIRTDASVIFDTLFYDNIYYITSKKLPYKPKVLKETLLIQPHELYNKSIAAKTYQRIADFKAFKFINIQFQPVNVDSSDLLNCEIQVSPMKRQSYTIQAQGTNTSGNLGIAGDFIYQNKNFFKGLELFEIRLNAAVEVQQILSNVDDNVGNINSFLPFNTFLFGPEASIQLPKIPRITRFLGLNNQKTKFITSYNFQQRPDYQRTIFNVAYSLTAKPNQYVTHIFNPFEVNFITVNLGNTFENLLNLSNNLFLKNSFKSQLITATKFSFIYNNQKIGKAKGFIFFQGNVESSGNILKASRRLFKNPAQNSDNYYVVFGVPFSQYVRIDTDLRYYYYTGKTSSLAFRNIIGVGFPYGNSGVMPFVKSFFGGGSNGIRAWIARSLGPGSYSDSAGIRFDQIGDIKLEWNAEYRAKIYKLIEGAFFVDAGNIWLRKPDPFRPNGEFKMDRFYKEIAIGAGLGLRLNFDFFIVRLDAAIPLRDPSFPIDERWRFSKLDAKRINLNFGIGYPF